MELTNHILLFGSFLFLASVLGSMLSTRLGIPLLLVFLVLGMLAGEDGPGGINFDDFQTAHLFGSLALAVILFDGGLKTDTRSFRVGLWPALVLATVGVVITAAITGGLAAWLLELSWLEGLLIGAIVGSTDAAAVFSLLHSAGLQLKQRTGATLEIESGTNDPMAIFLTIGLVELLAAGQSDLEWSLLGEFIAQMGLGVAMGLAGGFALEWTINRIVLSASLYPLLTLGGALLIFAITSVVGGSGFLAIYLIGLLLGNRPVQAVQSVRRFHDGMTVGHAVQSTSDCLARARNRFDPDPGSKTLGGCHRSSTISLPMARANIHLLGGIAWRRSNYSRHFPTAGGAG